MPSASVSDRDQREGRRVPQLPERELHIVPEFFEPQGQAHFTISLSAKVDAGLLTMTTSPMH